MRATCDSSGRSVSASTSTTAARVVRPWSSKPTSKPAMLRSGDDPAAHGDAGAVLKALYAAGVTGVFSDFPRLAVRARG